MGPATHCKDIGQGSSDYLGEGTHLSNANLGRSFLAGLPIFCFSESNPQVFCLGPGVVLSIIAGKG